MAMSNLRFTGAEMIIEPGIKSGLKKYEKDKMDGREMIRQNVRTVQHFSTSSSGLRMKLSTGVINN